MLYYKSEHGVSQVARGKESACYAGAMDSISGSWRSLKRNGSLLHLQLLRRFSRVRPVRPHRRQPTRLPCRWDSPGKNTAVGCHCLLQCMRVKRESEVAQSCLTLRDPMDCSPPGSSVHGIFQARVLEWGAIAFSPAPVLPGKFHGQRNVGGLQLIRS